MEQKLFYVFQILKLNAPIFMEFSENAFFCGYAIY